MCSANRQYLQDNAGKIYQSMNSGYSNLQYINHAALTPPCTFLSTGFPLQSTKPPTAMALPTNSRLLPLDYYLLIAHLPTQGV